MMALALRLLTSRAGLMAFVCAAMVTFHLVQIRKAVAEARAGYVRQVELAAAQAQLDSLQRRIDAQALANEALRGQVAEAEAAAEQFSAELEAFERDTKINPDGRVDRDLHRRLRAR